jgi:membrane-bound serine protease (ClpP class)
LDSPQVIDYQPSLREKLITSIADPNIAFIILILGALGIYVEFTSPGLILPGVAGGIMVLLGLSALSVLPINMVAVGLLILAVALFVLEAKVASHGILSGGAAVAMVLGAVMLVEGPPEVRIRWSTAIAVTLPFAIITAFLVALVVRARRNKVVTGDKGMIGLEGESITPLQPAGKIFVRGEYWDAISSAPVSPGARVRVTAVEGLKLVVEPF